MLDSAEWLTVVEAASIAGVAVRTLRRWVSEGRVESRVGRADHHPVRLVLRSSIPSSGTEGQCQSSAPQHTETVTGSADPSPVSSSATDDHPRDQSHAAELELAAVRAERDRLADETRWLRGRLEEASVETRELRILLARALPEPRHQIALEAQNVTPSAPTTARVRWWWPWKG